jgi:hypothetical protein
MWARLPYPGFLTYLRAHPGAVLVGVSRLFNEIQDGVFMSFQSRIWIGTS